MAAPPEDEALKEKELEVAQILCQLPKLVVEAENRRLPNYLRWGARRRRSALDDDTLLLPPLPPPPPSISPPPDGNDERKDGGRATSSPATPLSFPASGGEEPDGGPSRPPSFPPLKAFKNGKQHKEWVKEQSQLIASLSDKKAYLQRTIEQFKVMREELKAKNSWLRVLQSKAEKEAMEEERQRKRQRVDAVAPLGPTTFQSPATRSLDDPHRHPRNQWWAVPPPPSVALLAVDGTPSPAPAGNRVALDLNATPADEEEECEWSSADKAEMSARARKRRLEIQREKNNGYPSSSSPSSLSMAHKMPRFK